MKTIVTRLAVVCLSAYVVVLSGQTPQVSTASGDFAGRWQIQLRPPDPSSSMIAGGDIPLAIVDIKNINGNLSATVIDTMGAPLSTGKIADISLKDGQLLLSLEMTIVGQTNTMKLVGKRVGDRLEGTATVANDPQSASWTAQLTTLDKLPLPAPAAPRAQTEDQKALDQAMAKANATERREALQKFLVDFPSSRLKEPAEYRITQTYTNPQEREAAQTKFAKDYPKSPWTAEIYRTLWENALAAKPVDQAKLFAAINGFIEVSPPNSIGTGANQFNPRAGAMNTVADRLMTSEVALDKALEVIQGALELAGDKEAPRTRAIYTTTYGQVLFKLKRYDEAERQLKLANQLAGGDGEAEAQWFLGKLAEVRNDDTSAMDLYLKALAIDARPTIKASLDELWVKKHGSRAGLEEKLDEIYLARPKPFDAGHFTRQTSTENARVVLAELFTGAECGPCVASDMAFDGLIERYGRDSVAVLEYHLHIPGPDPMTNADTEARATFYNIHATPTVLIDGQAVGGGGGPAGASQQFFKRYTDRIETGIDKAAGARLMGFRARINGKTIELTGTAALMEGNGPAHLHVAVADDVVRYTGSNGIRFHKLVVRQLDSDASAYISSPEYVVSISRTIDPSLLTEAQEAYLTKYEKTQVDRGRTFKFSDHVSRIDLSHLKIVAFIQDDKTKQVLQAIVITPAN